MLLGEVSLESENYEQAVTDITDCLAKRKVCIEKLNIDCYDYVL